MTPMLFSCKEFRPLLPLLRKAHTHTPYMIPEEEFMTVAHVVPPTLHVWASKRGSANFRTRGFGYDPEFGP